MSSLPLHPYCDVGLGSWPRPQIGLSQPNDQTRGSHAQANPQPQVNHSVNWQTNPLSEQRSPCPPHLAGPIGVISRPPRCRIRGGGWTRGWVLKKEGRQKKQPRGHSSILKWQKYGFLPCLYLALLSSAVWFLSFLCVRKFSQHPNFWLSVAAAFCNV